MVTIFNLVGFTLCFLSISLIVGYAFPELTVDTYHKNRDRIFAVSPYSDGTWVGNILIDIMKDRSAFDKVIPYGFDNDKSYLRNGENQPIESEALFVDSSFFDAFSFKFIAGDRKNCVNVPFSIVFTQSEAKRFFGNEDPIGKKLKYNAIHEVTVTGIIEDYPGNSIFRSQSFISYSSLRTLTPYTFKCGWNCSNVKAFVMLGSPSKKAMAVEELKNCLKERNNDDSELNPGLFSLHDYYFSKEFEVPEQMNKGDMTRVIIFSSLGILIFIIALFNYFNLSMALLIARRKESAMLKIFGSSFWQQWLLLFSDAFVLAVIAWLFSLLLEEALLSTSIGKTLLLSEKSWSAVSAGLIPFIVTILLSLLAGLAGALYVRKCSVQDVYKQHQGDGKNGFQMIMITVQFCIVTFLIGATLTTRKQVNFMQQCNPGYSKENLICLESLFKLKNPGEVLKREFLSIPGVLNVSFSDAIPGKQTQNWGTEITVAGEPKDLTMSVVPVCSDFLETYGFKLKEGRFFSDSISTDYGNIVINEAAAKETGWDDPIGETLYNWKINGRKMGGKIVGVVKDNYFQSMHQEIASMVFANLPDYSGYITLKVIGGLENQKRIISSVKEKWQILEPDFPFRFFYFDQYLNQKYNKEMELEKLSLFLSIISIIITALGLIAVSLFITRKKTKEIGIRMVNGAKAGEIIRWLNSRFYLPLLFSIALALPLIWWFMTRWLESFAYKTDISWWILALSGLVTIIIVLACITWQSRRAARRNPVDALRYE